MSCRLHLSCGRCVFALVAFFMALNVSRQFAMAGTNDAPGQIVFNRDIRPILSNNCFQCHGPDRIQRQAELRLDQEAGALAPLASGAGSTIVPGDSAASILMERVTSTDESLVMPPPETGKKLTPEQIETLRAWIDGGAGWQKHWSFLKPERPDVPAVGNAAWPRNPIDHFVLARLELPGALSCFLIALDLFGAKPISVRYFAADGQYVDDDFTNVEIRYVMPDGGPPRVFRHHGSLSGIAVGPGAAVILRGSLAASWRSTALREQILRADWILSDGSGPSPKELERAGFTLETYGQFGGRPERLVPFHFGQVDAARNYPLLVARRDAAWKSVPVVLTASTSTTTPPEWTTWRASDVPDVAPIVEGGKHARLLTAEGPVHVWRPAGYNPASAGIAIYLHGYFTTVDRAWIDHRLAAQFAASGRNALFIVPEASIGDEEMPPYLDLEALLAVVEKSGVTIPSGPLVVAAHSGGFRGLIVWLANPRVKQVVMIDALYGKLEELRAWLDRPGHKAILIGAETDARSTYFTRKRKSAARRETMPLAASELTPKERRATVLSILAQHDHMGLIVSGQVLPVALEVSDLPALRRRKK